MLQTTEQKGWVGQDFKVNKIAHKQMHPIKRLRQGLTSFS